MEEDPYNLFSKYFFVVMFNFDYIRWILNTVASGSYVAIKVKKNRIFSGLILCRFFFYIFPIFSQINFC